MLPSGGHGWWPRPGSASGGPTRRRPGRRGRRVGGLGRLGSDGPDGPCRRRSASGAGRHRGRDATPG
ncbi:MAG TPA: hypothetical protein DCZ35_02055 [Acidimicrobiaceae bacterium]|nr:hypothetical protein [Acidimicrobiaceae bacterium]